MGLGVEGLGKGLTRLYGLPRASNAPSRRRAVPLTAIPQPPLSRCPEEDSEPRYYGPLGEGGLGVLDHQVYLALGLILDLAHVLAVALQERALLYGQVLVQNVADHAGAETNTSVHRGWNCRLWTGRVAWRLHGAPPRRC